MNDCIPTEVIESCALTAVLESVDCYIGFDGTSWSTWSRDELMPCNVPCLRCKLTANGESWVDLTDEMRAALTAEIEAELNAEAT